MKAFYRFGFDIGGTFTDFTLVNQATGEVLVDKCLTSPHDPEQAVLAGIKKLAARSPDFLAATTEAIHATTLLTNVAIERNGAKTGLITTKGFRDIIQIAREVRYDLYDLFIRFPPPLVPRRLPTPEIVIGLVLKISSPRATERRASSLLRVHAS